jgi:hypothetical protein
MMYRAHDVRAYQDMKLVESKPLLGPRGLSSCRFTCCVGPICRDVHSSVRPSVCVDPKLAHAQIVHESCRALFFYIRRPSVHAVFCSCAFAWRSCKCQVFRRLGSPPQQNLSCGVCKHSRAPGAALRQRYVSSRCDNLLRTLWRHTDIKLPRRDHAFVLLHGWSRPFDLRRPAATAEFCSHAFAWRSCKWLRPLLILGSSSLRPHAAFARCVASGPSGVSFAFSFVCLRPCAFAST